MEKIRHNLTILFRQKCDSGWINRSVMNEHRRVTRLGRKKTEHAGLRREPGDFRRGAAYYSRLCPLGAVGRQRPALGLYRRSRSGDPLQDRRLLYETDGAKA